jgi:hypothetical protein
LARKKRNRKTEIAIVYRTPAGHLIAYGHFGQRIPISENDLTEETVIHPAPWYIGKPEKRKSKKGESR